MIYTLTTNPAIDMSISSTGFFPNKVNRTFDAIYTPNGKGLNVSFVLKHFGISSKILGFFGGFSGQFIVNEVIGRHFEVLPIWIDDTTRINVFLNDGEKEYKLVNEGAFIPPNKQIALLNQLESLNDLEFLSISGSLPKGIDNNYYEEILKICAEKNTKIILDISSSNLKALLSYKPYLIKPNDDEVRDIFGIDIQNEREAVHALRELNRFGAQNILLTLGEKGAYFFNGRQMYYAHAQPIKLVSSACAGDSALAAFLSVWLNDPENITEALKLSAATGANVAESNGIGDLSKVREYKENITVKVVQ